MSDNARELAIVQWCRDKEPNSLVVFINYRDRGNHYLPQDPVDAVVEVCDHTHRYLGKDTPPGFVSMRINKGMTSTGMVVDGSLFPDPTLWPRCAAVILARQIEGYDPMPPWSTLDGRL